MIKKTLILFLNLSLIAAAHVYPQTAEEEAAQFNQAIEASLKTIPNPLLLQSPFIGMPEVYSLHINRLPKFISALETHISKSANEEEKLELIQFLELVKERQITSLRYSVCEAKDRSLINHAHNIIIDFRREDESLPVFYFSKFKTFQDTLNG